MKSLFTLLVVCFLQTILFAQKNNGPKCDTIVLKNGKTITAEIEKTTETEIFYTRCGAESGGQRSIIRSFVKEIRTSKGVKTMPEAMDLPAISDSSKLWHINTKDGNDYIGTIVSQNTDKVIIRTTALGEVGIPKSQIKVMELIQKEQMINGDFWYESPHNTRYFWAPNGYGLRKGEGYYQNTWVLLNQAAFGVSDNFSIGVGMIPTFLFGASGFPFWITPKVSIPLKKDEVNLGAGLLYVNTVGLGLDGGGGAGIAYGVLTAGPRDRNLTLGLGYGFAGGGWSDYPTITISGMYRTSKKFTLLTENYIIPLGDGQKFGIISIGGRYGGKNVALDFGLFRPLSSDFGEGFWALPWLGINVPFGKHR